MTKWDIYFCRLMLTVSHYFIESYLILKIIYVVWMYNIGCRIFRWPCESLWAPGLLGAEELATSGDHLILFNYYFYHSQFTLLKNCWQFEVLCILKNQGLLVCHIFISSFLVFFSCFPVIKSLLSLGCSMWLLNFKLPLLYFLSSPQLFSPLFDARGDEIYMKNL